MVIRIVRTLLFVAVAGGLFANRTSGESEIKARLPSAPATLDQLPLLPRCISVHQFSSRNKKGLNGDADWFLYKDENGDPVIFDAAGPGCVRSMWGTAFAPEQIFKFYFDGEAAPRYTIPVLNFYRGKHPLFPPPLVSYEKVGYWGDNPYAGNSFVPIPFAKSLKISIQGPVAFYHVLYERYPFGTPLATFTGNEDRAYLRQAFARQGEELQPVAGTKTIRTAIDILKPKERRPILDIKEAGTITRIAIEGGDSETFLNQIEIEMQWDDSLRPDVKAPLGMFFGAAVRAENVRSLPTKVEKLAENRLRLASHYRMPFWRQGRVTLVNRSGQSTGPVAATIELAPQRYAENEAGYFCALYRDGRTEMGRDWLFFDATGTGWFIGAVQTMFGEHYCEGNERFAMDGVGTPQILGTGSEDYYLACFWSNRHFNLPFAGCVGDIQVQPGPACYYRFHLEAPIPFYSLLDARIQHGGRSDIVSQYRSLGFCYLRKQPAVRQTDFLDVGNATSEKTHGYRATRSASAMEIAAACEGGADETIVRDWGRSHSGGEIKFTIAVDPENNGVRLRRRLDQNSPRQAAEVYVDGRFAGIWYHADHNPYLRWFDSDYDLLAELTRGKAKLKIRLAVRKDGGYGDFTDFQYHVFSFVNPRLDRRDLRGDF